MCFFITLHVKETIAKKDITFYKIGVCMGNRFKSYLRDYYYTENTTQRPIKLQQLLPSNENISKYDWSATDYNHQKYIRAYHIDWNDTPSIQEGYHGYINADKINNNYDLNIGIFIIPKGTRYYYNRKSNLLVAETCYWTGKTL